MLNVRRSRDALRVVGWSVLGVSALLWCVSIGPATAAVSMHRCDLPEFASGELIVHGVTCGAAARVVHRALRKPGCTPTAEQAGAGRGCQGVTTAGRWTCRGLFPGEGYDLRCRSGARRIRASAGG